MVPDLSADFKDLPTDYQRVLSLAQERHSIKITPLEELKGGRTGARLYLVSVSSATPANGSAPGETRDAVQHFVLKVDRINPKAKTDEMTRHALAVHRAPSDFAAQHLADLAFERVEHEGAIAIFYAIAGQSLHRFQPLASFRRQSQLETIFRATFDILLAEWNAQLSFEQAVHPQSLLERWLGYRLKSGGNIERLLEDVFHIHHGTAGFLIQGHVFPNPLVYAREPERWGPIRLIDAIIGMQHGDLNITNILARFASNERDVDGFYLIDFALFQEQMPLLYDQAYLEMSYLLRELSRVPFQEWVGLVTHLAELDIPCPDQVSASLTGACAVIAAGRAEYDRWLQASHASLYDDLWGQFWLAAVAAGLNFCNKAPLSERERLGGLIYAAAHLKRYLTRFGARMPVQISHLYDASQSDAGQESDATLRAPALRINNLPVQPSPLVGREKEVLEVRDMARCGS
jgi:hypothetical protein